jgi:hypothetical protein
VVTVTELVVPVEIAAPADVVWRTVTDWERQGEWILGTRVRATGPGDGRRLGARFTAFTGIGPLGFDDPMEVTEWDPPRRCVVHHLGRVVRGDGVFTVTELGPHRSRFDWCERLELPLGRLGALGWPLVRPVFRAGVQHSLRRLARLCESPHRGPGG